MDAQNVGIRNSWSLLAFARSHGRMQVGQFEAVDQESGEIRKFRSCIFTNPADESQKVFVGFSSKMGELTPAQISAQKADLQVVELESGNFILCRQGSNSWEDVEL